VSVATCPTCGAGWNVAGIVGIAAIQCQRCGGQVPLAVAPAAQAAPAAAQGWPGGASVLSGEGILAMPAAPGTPIGENAVPCGHCGTVLDAAGLSVGMMLRCGRCGGVFPRPHPSQLAAVIAAQAPPPPPAASFAPQHSPGPQAAPAPAKASDSSGEFSLELKETTRCPGCGREYYDEELPPADDEGKIR
jgi:hypothetical protein